MSFCGPGQQFDSLEYGIESVRSNITMSHNNAINQPSFLNHVHARMLSNACVTFSIDNVDNRLWHFALTFFLAKARSDSAALFVWVMIFIFSCCTNCTYCALKLASGCLATQKER